MAINQSSEKSGIRSAVIMTQRKWRTLEAIRNATEFCGYDIDEIMSNRTRQRIYTDLRAIIWLIYQNAMRYSCTQVGIDYGWDRCTVFSAIRRAKELRKTDRNFADIFDAIEGAFSDAYARLENKSDNIIN